VPRRRGGGADDIPERLLRWRAADWPSPQTWWEARTAWLEEHPPASLDELNGWYADAAQWPPAPDPREVR
jgi:hypothetical protein